MTDELQTRLSDEVHRVDWAPLAAHAKRGGLVLVDPALNLVEVAVAVASDDSARVESWMGAQLLTKPTQAQIASWESDAEDRFAIVIVQPYVLAQRHSGIQAG